MQTTNVNNLVINKLTKSQFNSTTPSSTELYFVTDDTGLTAGSGISINQSTATISLSQTYAGGTAITLNGASKASSTASFYAPTGSGTADKQALVSKGSEVAPNWINISPSITITDGTGSAAPKINVTVLGQSGTTAQSITTASTSVYGVTKLSSTSSSSEQGLAATPKLIYDSIAALDVSNISGFGAGKTLSALSESDGKISATFQNISITKSQVSDFPTALSAFTNDTNYITAASIPNLSGGTAAANNATVVGGVTVNGHAVTVATKTITAGTATSVSGTTTAVTIGVDTSKLYWANKNISTSASYITDPEVKQITINGSSTAVTGNDGHKNVTLIYNSSTKALDFNFS